MRLSVGNKAVSKKVQKWLEGVGGLGELAWGFVIAGWWGLGKDSQAWTEICMAWTSCWHQRKVHSNCFIYFVEQKRKGSRGSEGCQQSNIKNGVRLLITLGSHQHMASQVVLEVNMQPEDKRKRKMEGYLGSLIVTLGNGGYIPSFHIPSVRTKSPRSWTVQFPATTMEGGGNLQCMASLFCHSGMQATMNLGFVRPEVWIIWRPSLETNKVYRHQLRKGSMQVRALKPKTPQLYYKGFPLQVTPRWS